ncbi:MAG: thioesterase [Halobacteriovoraceae bacterium]|nr:thioesterase [Halobacteriovoraceae bacterium]
MDLKSEYKSKLLSAIPVVSAMEVDITEIGLRELTLTAPLNTNINYEGTAFGGSLNTLCILSGYLLVHHTMHSEQMHIDSLVIQDSQIKYQGPVNDNFYATARVEQADRDKFLTMLKRKGTGRIKIYSSVKTGSEEGLVSFSARFVASSSSTDSVSS